MYTYVAILVPDAEAGGYSVLFPDLPGCATQGEDMNSAFSAATEALAGHIAVMREYKEEVPAARSLESIQADKKFAKENEINWNTATAVLVPVRPPLGKPERVNVSLDSNMLRALDVYAETRGLTRSAVLEAGAELLMQHDPVIAEVSPVTGRVSHGHVTIARDAKTGRLSLEPKGGRMLRPARAHKK
jgi:predicted RNase H-like HicB family nuclease